MSRGSPLRMLLISLALCGVALPQAAGADDGFDRFCTVWMGKLAARERDNLKSAQARSGSGGVVLEYIGYASQPIRCQARIPKPGKPGVGILVYNEIRYRRSGSDAVKARSSEPAVVSQVEVTELFRFDGSRWIY